MNLLPCEDERPLGGSGGGGENGLDHCIPIYILKVLRQDQGDIEAEEGFWERRVVRRGATVAAGAADCNGVEYEK